MEKRGLASTIKWMILLVLSFLIILLLIMRFGWKEESQTQICHQSVVIRASTVYEGTQTLDLPLKCKTEKICLTIGGRQNCEEDFLGEKYDKIEIKGKTQKEKQDEINKILSTKLEECWWMMGGAQKLNVYGRQAATQRYCNICSRIAFSKELKQEFNNQLKGTNKYLLTEKSQYIEGTPWQFLTNNPSNIMEGYSEEKDIKSMEQKAIVFSEYNMAKIYEWAIGGSLVILGSFVPVVGPVAGAGIGGALAQTDPVKEIGDYLTSIMNKEEEDIAAAVLLINYDEKELLDMECTAFKGTL